MTDLNRTRELAGFHPKRDLVAELKSSRQQLTSDFDVMIKQVENGVQIDEGFFTSLTAALKTVGQATKSGAKAAVEKAAKLSNNLRQMYLDNKAQAELKNMIDSIARINHTLEGIEKEAPTVLSKDTEVKTALGLLKDVLIKVIDQLSARIAVPSAQAEGREVTITDIEKVLAESAERIADTYEFSTDESTMLTEITVGDRVIIVKNSSGGLPLDTSKTRISVGSSARVIKIDDDGDIVVQFDSSGERMAVRQDNLKVVESRLTEAGIDAFVKAGFPTHQEADIKESSGEKDHELEEYILNELDKAFKTLVKDHQLPVGPERAQKIARAAKLAKDAVKSVM